jgi:integrase
VAKRPKLDHVKFVPAKGKLYAYFNTGKRVNGKPVRVPLPAFGSDGFFEAYAAQLARRNRRADAVLTLSGLIARYVASEDWKALSKGSQQLYGLTLKRVDDQLGKLTAEKVERAHVREVLNNRMTGNGARNIFLAVVGILFKWARDNDLVSEHKNPTSGIKPFRLGEHEPWPDALVQAGLKSDTARVRLAVHLLYFTGQRIGDVMRMRWPDIRDGAIYVTQQKTGKELRVPLHSELSAELARTPKRGLTIITNWRGHPMRQDVVRKELKAFAGTQGFDLVPHGLRKSAVHALLFAGCSTDEVMAITGQSQNMVDHYAKKIDQHRLGDAAILKLERKATGQTSGKTAGKNQ